MIRRVRVFLFILMLNRSAVAQTAEELAQSAARTMQRLDYATAEFLDLGSWLLIAVELFNLAGVSHMWS